MSIWNQGFYFEPHDDANRFIFRLTPLSPGYSVARDEKNAVFAALKQAEWRSFRDILVVFALAAFIALGNIIPSTSKLQLFMALAIVGMLPLTLVAYHRKRKRAAEILGHRPPDCPRLTWRQMMLRPQPVFAKRYATVGLKAVTGLLVLCLVIGNSIVARLIYSIHRAVASEGVVLTAKAEALNALTYQNPVFWIIWAAFNLFIIAILALSVWQIRQIQRTPDIS